MGNGRHRHMQFLGNLPHASGLVKECIENFNPGTVTKNFVELCQVIQHFLCGDHMLPGGLGESFHPATLPLSFESSLKFKISISKNGLPVKPLRKSVAGLSPCDALTLGMTLVQK